MKTNTKKMVGIAMLTAVVVALQFLGSYIKFGTFSISLVLIPIVVGTALYGVGAGAWLGLAFGVTVLASGDASLFLAVNPVGAVITVLLKGTLAGVCAGLVYKCIEKNKYAAVVASAVVCPLVNTGVFLLGCLVFFMDTIRQWAAGMGFESVGTYMLVGLVGVNFLIELGVNVVLGPVIVRIVNIGRKQAK